MKICNRCGSSETVQREVGMHLMEFCKGCDAWIKNVPKAWTAQRASEFQMSFGKHKGMTLGLLMNLHPDYVRWMAKELDPSSNAAKAARKLLDESNEKR